MTRVCVLLSVCVVLLGAGQVAGSNNHHEERLNSKHRMHMEEMKHLNSVPDHAVEDWSLHTDVDDSVYWFSRSLKRSVKEAPKGWTKDADGKWQRPPSSRDEL